MAEALREWGPALLAWVVLASRGLGGSPARRRVRWVLFGLACSLTAQIPLIYAALGDGHLARLLSHAGMVFAAWAGQEFMSVLTGHPRGARWQAWWAGGTFGVMCLLFALMPDLRPQSAWVMEYCLVYAAAQLPALLTVIGLGARYARAAGDAAIRASLWLVVAGTALALLYLLNKSALAVAPRLGTTFGFGRTVLPSKILPTTAYLLVLIGAALPAVVGWRRRHRQFRRLGPLWQALYRADPSIALDPPGGPDVLVLRDLRLRLYRRVIEIRDGLLALQPYRCPEVAARTEADGAAAAEAAVIAAALTARADGATPVNRPAGVTGGTDLAEDTEFLAEVSDVYRRLSRSARPGR
ncbi:MAB_1171c family putative transporter [Amycolatopsis sp. 195334CR]|uniref:MAB_1171c family putative transporter n=1 Tax=Amycolatopsis sp. 195334CR TaxID=2814588 RepID=UPI001A8C69A0|nr:MAB_1171c family putative transporter [Amycolatopsis sp. 195334CR]MBN6039556.1 hypothetical protein [Amycolatopsis sp. 195334CR]